MNMKSEMSYQMVHSLRESLAEDESMALWTQKFKSAEGWEVYEHGDESIDDYIFHSYVLEENLIGGQSKTTWQA